MDCCRISLSMLPIWSRPSWTEFLCSFCGFLPRNPVITRCGHYLCFECALGLLTRPDPPCPKGDCEKMIAFHMTGGIIHPLFSLDDRLRYEIGLLAVKCANSAKGCTWTGAVNELQQHFETCQIGTTKPEPCLQMALTEQSLASLRLQKTGPPAELTSTFCNLKEELDDLKRTVTEKETIIASLRNRIQKLKENRNRIQQFLAHFSKDEKLQKAATDSMIRRTFFLEYGPNNGSMLWKVPEYSQKIIEARTEERTFFFSPPFYTNRYGYKLCLCMYPQGDGTGLLTHMSLYIVLMKGEYDDLLQWPFAYSVSLKLLHRFDQRIVAETIEPDPHSISFQKPTTEKNPAIGFPKFIKLSKLLTGEYIQDDNVFIRVKVDVDSIVPP